MTDEGWEARMAARARERRINAVALDRGERRTDDFSVYRLPDDPEQINPQILAARCLGIEYGDPGPRLPADACRECWGDRHVWYGNGWGMKHVGSDHEYPGCPHECHIGEVLIA